MALSGFSHADLPLRIAPWKMIVGGNTFPLAEMIGTMLAVSLTSFLNAICCSALAASM